METVEESKIVDYRKDMLVIRQREAFQFLKNAIERCRQEGIDANDVFEFVLDVLKENYQ